MFTYKGDAETRDRRSQRDGLKATIDVISPKEMIFTFESVFLIKDADFYVLTLGGASEHDTIMMSWWIDETVDGFNFQYQCQQDKP